VVGVPAAGLGPGLVLHGMSVFLLGTGSGLRERMVQKERERLQRQQTGLAARRENRRDHKLQHLLQTMAFCLAMATIQCIFMPERPYGAAGGLFAG
jgi:hypothetical protein